MEEDGLSESSNKITSFIKENLLVVILFATGLMLLAGGLSVMLNNPKPEVTLEQSSAADLKQEDKKEIFVDIEGAVVKPGVYKLRANSRIQDALIAAGGLSQDADRDYISKSINMAKPIADGEKIYFPQVSDVKGMATSGNADVAPSSLININQAGISDLDKLPGIGIVTAQKIVDNRPYGAIDDLLNKKIVTQKVFEQIKVKVSVY